MSGVNQNVFNDDAPPQQSQEEFSSLITSFGALGNTEGKKMLKMLSH